MKLQFVCNSKTDYPIIPTYDFKFKGMELIREDFKVCLHAENYQGPHTGLCKGLKDVSKTGWIQRAPIDISLDADSKLVYIFADKFWNDYFPNYKDNKVLYKIQSNYSVHIPEGYFLSLNPVFLNDNTQWYSMPGLLDNSTGPVDLNTFIIADMSNDPIVISAGAPLAQYYLIPKIQNNIEVIFKDAEYDDDENQAVRQFLLTEHSELKKRGIIYQELKSYEWKI